MNTPNSKCVCGCNVFTHYTRYSTLGWFTSNTTYSRLYMAHITTYEISHYSKPNSHLKYILTWVSECLNVHPLYWGQIQRFLPILTLTIEMTFHSRFFLSQSHWILNNIFLVHTPSSMYLHKRYTRRESTTSLQYFNHYYTVWSRFYIFR